MGLKKKKISELIPAPYNPRIDLQPEDVEYQQLKRSIEHFGYVVPIIVNKRTGYVVGGNQRLKVLKDLGIEDVDVVEVDLPESKEKALNVALNRISGEWDIETLQVILKELDENELDLSGFGEESIDVFIEREKEEQEKIKMIKFRIECDEEQKREIEKDLTEILGRQVRLEI